MIEVKTYEDFCEGFHGDEQIRRMSEILFMLRKNFSVLNELDPLGNGFVFLDEPIDDWARFDKVQQDYLAPSVKKISKVFSHIVDNLRNRILRENVLMPLHKAKEINSHSIAWLSKRSGRTVREKLSGKKSILAVRRRLSFDTGENRLLKEFARQLEDAIFLKNSTLPADLLNDDEKFLSEKLRRFRYSDEAQEISPWNNLPPNNTLLEDRAYNSVWRAWNDLQKINELIADDCRNIGERLCSLAKIFLLLIAGKCFDFVRLPLIYDLKREDNRQYRLQFLRGKIFAIHSATKKLLTITPSKTEILIEYDGQKVQLKFSDLQLTLSDSESQEITAEKLSPLLTRVLQNISDEDFLSLKEITAENLSPLLTRALQSISDEDFLSLKEIVSRQPFTQEVTAEKLSPLLTRVLQNISDEDFMSLKEITAEKLSPLLTRALQNISDEDFMSLKKIVSRQPFTQEVTAENLSPLLTRALQSISDEDFLSLKEIVSRQPFTQEVTAEKLSPLLTRALQSISDEDFLSLKEIVSRQPFTQEVTAENLLPLLTRALQNLSDEDFLSLKKIVSRQPFTQEVTAEKFPFLLTRVLQNILGEDFLSLKIKTPVPEFKGESASADVFSLFPEIYSDGEQVRLSQALLLEKISARGKIFMSDCFSSRALPLPEKNFVTLQTVSGIVSTAENPELLKPLAARLRKILRVDNLISVCPDSFSEFELADFRKTLKLYFHRVRTVPKSLAAIFTCVEKNLLPSEFTADDWILILDRTADGFSVTPIKSRYDGTAAPELPEQRGLVWEHHPARIIETKFFDGLKLSDAAKNFLSVMSAKDFIRLTERVSFVDSDGNLKDFSEDVRLLKNFHLSTEDALQKYISEREKFFGGKKIWLMTLSDELTCENFDRIDLSNEFLIGGVDYFETSRIRTRVPLWRDCLPDLSIKRLYGTFDLVKNSNFEYGGKTEMLIPIPGGRNFVLPKGQQSYRFTLHMSDGSEKNFYAAVVEHKNFPLKDDAECRLIMKYTYGEDNPYSLKFVPLSPKTAGFNEALVRWERLEKFPADGLKYPEFPQSIRSTEILKQTVELLDELTALQKFRVNPNLYVQKGKATYTRTKLDDGQDAVLFTIDKSFSPKDEFIYGVANPSNRKRLCLDVSGEDDWFENNRGNMQLNMPYTIDGQEYTLVFYDNSFLFEDEFDEDFEQLSFNLRRSKDGSLYVGRGGYIYAENILVEDEESDDEPIRFYHVNRELNDRIINYRLRSLRGKLLGCLHQIYFNGGSLSDSNYPPELAERLRGGLAKIYELYKTFSGEIREKLQTVLCIAAKDVDASFYDVVDLSRHEVGLMFGDFTEERQQRLFERCRELNDEKLLVCMLSKAAWGNENFIRNFPLKLTRKYFRTAIQMICDWTPYHVNRAEKLRAMEFIMAVFRLRERNDAKLNNFLSLNTSNVRSLRFRIERFIANGTFDFNKVKTRIKLDVKQSIEFAQYKIPNLFYALLTCITGESGDIVISDVSGEEQDDD